jgi:RsiW-degrading membrane proteinase PrsW (M82 family)
MASMIDYRIILYIFFGILPSLVWLFYYLSKDLHPEPKKMILKIFLWGSAITVPVFFVQIGLQKVLASANLPTLAYDLAYWFLIIAFSEELFKYFVVKAKAINSPAMDEPLDIMLYMVVAALGFTAVENILYLFSPTDQISFNEIMNRTMLISFIRFIGATFLHTLCSAIVGYFLAMSVCAAKNKHKILIFGLLAATLLHGLYDFSIITLTGSIQVAVPVAIILMLAILVFVGFDKLKKLKGICKIN